MAQERVDQWLRQRYPNLRRRHLEEALLGRLVVSTTGGRLGKGDSLHSDKLPDCSRLDRHLELLRAGNPDLNIPALLESEEIVAVDKPPGIPSHPISLFDTCTVTNWAMAHYPEVRQWATDCQPTVTPHRLDNDTSGVLLLARTRLAFDAWRARFGSGRVAKTYLAWCWGDGPARNLTIDTGIAHDPNDARKMIVVRDSQVRHRGRVLAAATSIRTLRQMADRFLCEIRMQTGVMHQIRVHLASSGTPLIGDRIYDEAFDLRAASEGRTLLRCIALACGELQVNAESDSFANLF